jgi:phosphatidate phosphatase APP1
MQTHIEMQMQMQMQCSHSLFLTLWLKPLKALRVFDQEAEKVATFTSSSAIAGYFVQTQYIPFHSRPWHLLTIPGERAQGEGEKLTV